MSDSTSSESLAEVRDTPDKPITEPRLYHNRPIAPVATPPPMVSSLHAQLRTDLWQQYPSGVGYFQHRAKGNPNNIIEHYIASPGDITLLPLDEAMQIIDRFGLTAAKLHLIFAAHIMRQEEPWKSLFTLEGSDLIKERLSCCLMLNAVGFGISINSGNIKRNFPRRKFSLALFLRDHNSSGKKAAPLPLTVFTTKARSRKSLRRSQEVSAISKHP